MVTLGVERGGDEKAIALIHASRIFLVVLTLPFLIQLFTERRSASPGAIFYPSRASNSLILGGSPLPLLQELEQASSCSFLPQPRGPDGSECCIALLGCNRFRDAERRAGSGPACDRSDSQLSLRIVIAGRDLEGYWPFDRGMP